MRTRRVNPANCNTGSAGRGAPFYQCMTHLARRVRKYYIPGDFAGWQDEDAFDAAFAKLIDNLRQSIPT